LILQKRQYGFGFCRRFILKTPAQRE
jgi:hypothetical protein